VKSTSYEASHYAFHHPVISSPFGSSTLHSILFSNTFIDYTIKILSTGSAVIRTHLGKNFSIKESDGHAIAQEVSHWHFAAVTARFNPRVVWKKWHLGRFFSKHFRSTLPSFHKYSVLIYHPQLVE
jgi:hypothetical protein